MNLPRRVVQHKLKPYPTAFTARYQFYKLVWFERAASQAAAEARELQIKGWTRAKKIALIQEMNPNWADLSKRFLIP